MNRRLWVGALFVAVFLYSPPAMAQHQHGGHSMPGVEGEKKVQSSPGNETSAVRTFLLEGVKAAFSVVPMAEHKKMLKDMGMKIEVDPQATHYIAVILTDTRNNQSWTDAVVKMKVIDPGGKEQVKLLDAIPAMNQYGQEFTLAAKGRYQVLIRFQKGDKKGAAGFYYLMK